jgi:hypothetical protein
MVPCCTIMFVFEQMLSMLAYKPIRSSQRYCDQAGTCKYYFNIQ